MSRVIYQVILTKLHAKIIILDKINLQLSDLHLLLDLFLWTFDLYFTILWTLLEWYHL